MVQLNWPLDMKCRRFTKKYKGVDDAVVEAYRVRETYFIKDKGILLRIIYEDDLKLYGDACGLSERLFIKDYEISKDDIGDVYVASIPQITVMSIAEQDFKKMVNENKRKMNKFLGRK